MKRYELTGNRGINILKDSENQKHRRCTTVPGKCKFCKQIH